MNYILQRIKRVICCMLKFRLLALLMLITLVLYGEYGTAQVYHYKTPLNGNAYEIPSDIPVSNSKRLIYIRSRKYNFTHLCANINFQECFSPVGGCFSESTTSGPFVVNDHFLYY